MTEHSTTLRGAAAALLREGVREAVPATDLARQQEANLEYFRYKNNPDIPLTEYVDVMLGRVARDESFLAVQHTLRRAEEANERKLYGAVFDWVALHLAVDVDHILAPAIRYLGQWSAAQLALPVARMLRQSRLRELDALVDAGYRFEGADLEAVQIVLSQRPQVRAAAVAQSLLVRYQLLANAPAAPVPGRCAPGL